MQPDPERLLRESRDALPELDPAAVRRLTKHVLARVERAVRRRRRPLVAGVAFTAVLGVALAASALVEERTTDTRPTGAAVCTRTFRSFLVEAGQWGLGSEKELFAIVGSQGADRPGGYAMWASVTAAASAIDRACVATRLPPESNRTTLGPRLRYMRTDTGNVYFRGGRQQLPSVRLHQRSIDPVANRLAFGIGFVCVLPGRVLVHTQPLRDGRGLEIGRHLSVRTERTNLVVATANLYRNQPSFFRISSRCERR